MSVRRDENIIPGDGLQLLPLGDGDLPQPGQAGRLVDAGESGEAGGRRGVV